MGSAEPGPVVVWLWGDHDLSTDETLSATLARAIAVDSVGLVLDLSEVESMAPSTLEVIVRAREFLRQRSASLTVRAPSAPARSSIEACALPDLLDANPATAGAEQARALGSWVAVPSAERDDGQPGPTTPEPQRVHARVGRTKT